MSDKSAKDSIEKKRGQKNIRVLNETSEKLAEMAESRYGSKQKQGQVVDDLVAMASADDGEDMLSLIKEIHASVVSSSSGGASLDTHTRTSPSSQTTQKDDSPAHELEQLAREEGTIDPEEHDLSVIKNVRGLDRPAIIKAALKGSSQSDGWTKTEIADNVQRWTLYGRNASLNIARDTVMQMYASPLVDIDEWVREQVQIDIREGINKPSHDQRNAMKDWKYEKNLSSGLLDYVGLDQPYTGHDQYYLDPQTLSNVVSTLVDDIIYAIDEANGNQPYLRRSQALIEACNRIASHTDKEVREQLLGITIQDVEYAREHNLLSDEVVNLLLDILDSDEQ